MASRRVKRSGMEIIMKIELHAHTQESSPCGRILAEDALKLYHDAGYTGICITDHYSKWVGESYGITEPDILVENFLKGRHAAKKASSKYNMTVFDGIEVTLLESPNDYLIYGASDEFLRANPAHYTMSLRELYELCQRNNLLLVQAHPNRGYCTPANPDLLNGAEAYNGNPHHNNHNDKTFEWARKHNLIMTSGSDFHVLEQLARGGIICDKDIKETDELIKLLKSQNYSLITE